MNYIVLDLEWNQSEEKRKENKLIPFEIIEIGAMKLDGKKNLVGEFSELIKPEVYSDMHHITQNLIQMEMEELERGKSFPVVMEQFLDWCGKSDYIFCTWGPTDLIELQRNMRYYEIPLFSKKPFPYLDVQKLFSIQFEDGKQRRTLEYAIDVLEIEKDVPFHRAFSDAYYTAKILQKISSQVLKLQSYDVFKLPQKRKDEIHVTFESYYKYISREFKTKQLAMCDMEVLNCKCYLCGKPTRKIIRWFTANNKHYHCISQCQEHGYLKGKIRLRKSEKSNYYVIKTLKFVDEETVKTIQERQNKAKETETNL